MPIKGNCAADLRTSAGDSVVFLAIHILHGHEIPICAIHGKGLLSQLVDRMRR